MSLFVFSYFLSILNFVSSTTNFSKRFQWVGRLQKVFAWSWALRFHFQLAPNRWIFDGSKLGCQCGTHRFCRIFSHVYSSKDIEFKINIIHFDDQLEPMPPIILSHTRLYTTVSAFQFRCEPWLNMATLATIVAKPSLVECWEIPSVRRSWISIGQWTACIWQSTFALRCQSRIHIFGCLASCRRSVASIESLAVSLQTAASRWWASWFIHGWHFCLWSLVYFVPFESFLSIYIILLFQNAFSYLSHGFWGLHVGDH